jgi:hypothetical protein
VESVRVEAAWGGEERPLSDGDLEAKFRLLASGAIDPGSADRALEMIGELQSLPDVSELGRCLAGRD